MHGYIYSIVIADTISILGVVLFVSMQELKASALANFVTDGHQVLMHGLMPHQSLKSICHKFTGAEALDSPNVWPLAWYKKTCTHVHKCKQTNTKPINLHDHK